MLWNKTAFFNGLAGKFKDLKLFEAVLGLEFRLQAVRAA